MRFILALLILVFAAVTKAAPSDIPHRKSGLWEIKIQTPEMEMPLFSQHCIDEKTDHLLPQQEQTRAKQTCRKNALHKEGDKIIIESECKFEGCTANSKAVFSGDFSHRYRGEIHTTYTPSLHGMKSSMQILEGQWLGACKPGQNPGDVTVSAVGSINLNETIKNMPSDKSPHTP